MAKTKFFKRSALPTTWEANAFYFIVNSNFAESYVTSSAGVPKAIGNSEMINSLIDNKIAGMNMLEIVGTIAQRDALTLTANAMVLVTDATGDPTVGTGAALYAYSKANNSFTKVAEYESMDVTLQWSNIQGRPNSTPASIDLAVQNSHTHSNKAQLDKVSEDASGEISYNGSTVRPWDVVDW